MKLLKFVPIVMLPVLFSLNEVVEPATAQATHKAYILCETKTGDPERWFFSSIFMEGPEVRQSTMEVAFTNYVIRNYRNSTRNGIGPAGCYIERSREGAEDRHESQQKWATSNGNSVTETGWTYSE